MVGFILGIIFTVIVEALVVAWVCGDLPAGNGGKH